MSGCEEVQDILLALARGEGVSAPGQRFLREHTEDCPECCRRLANERMLSAGLAAVAAQAGGPSPAVRAALMSEFRRQRTVAPIRRMPLRARGWIAAGAAIAAMLLLAIFASLRQPPEKIATPTKIVAVPVNPPSPVAPVRAADPPVAETPQAGTAQRAAFTQSQSRKRNRPPKVRPIPAPDKTPEVATDFFAIPYAEPLRPEERTDIYRVQIPRAGMAAFGLPLVGGHLDARVTADVLMGEDGVVRAVRFIR